MTESRNNEFESDETLDNIEEGNGGDEREIEVPKPQRQESTKMEAPNNIVLLGAMGSGKTSIGRLLAHAIGFGFIDLDAYIETREKKPVTQIFEDEGEPRFRELESAAVKTLVGIKSHVIAVGGGTLVDPSNWAMLRAMGTTVWVNPSPDEIARRFLADLDQIKRRPLLAELLDLSDREERQRLLKERLTALLDQRKQSYREAQLEVVDSFSTPESSAGLVKDILVREGILNRSMEHRPYDRWHIL